MKWNTYTCDCDTCVNTGGCHLGIKDYLWIFLGWAILYTIGTETLSEWGSAAVLFFIG